MKNFTASSRGITRALDRDVALRDLGHALLDRGEIFGRERPLVREVVVEAVLDHRTDRHLRIGEQLLHRVRQQVRGRVADDFEPLGILVGDDGDIGVGIDHVCGIDQLAVDACRPSAAGEAGADRRGDLRHGDRMIVGTDGAVRKFHIRHENQRCACGALPSKRLAALRQKNQRCARSSAYLYAPRGATDIKYKQKKCGGPHFLQSGRRDWDRTNDLHHVKVAL